MKKWDDFVAWMDKFPKVTTHEVVFDDKRIVATPFAIEAPDEESAKLYLMDQVTAGINDKSSVFVRVMPEVSAVNKFDGTPTGRYRGYARLAIG